MNRSYENVILKALDEPEKRFQTMADLLNDVRALRQGANPMANNEGQLDDDACLILGTAFTHYAPEKEPTSVYRLEQALSIKLNRFAFALGLSKLRQCQFIQDVYADENWAGLIVTSTGEAWVEANQSRIGSLINFLSPSQEIADPSDYEEIPF